MGDREKTKHKGIYRVGSNYYVIYNDGTTRLSKKGEEYLVRRERIKFLGYKPEGITLLYCVCLTPDFEA